ncbi:MAG: FAD-dependent oxidoreductase [Proteobacteria bacterium]|nr:FAD-dependent oxidoreductase [Pseudomonadota bacterium]MBU1736935.1 FAD-dependent oxidoreductase [Pseudomonadota bacterium]
MSMQSAASRQLRGPLGSLSAGMGVGGVEENKLPYEHCRHHGADSGSVILGGGLAGLAAGHRLTDAGHPVTVIEKGGAVGGLARTIRHGGFRFDLGGHRFLADNKQTMTLVSGLLGKELLTVPRSSRIFMNGKYVDYPLNPVNALLGLGISTTTSIIFDYAGEKIRRLISAGPPLISLEDWVVAHFGRIMFELYFKDYSEKVWGLNCSRISMEWVARRIDGLSLWKAVRHALFRLKSNGYKTLTDHFVYPRLGIGVLSDRLQERIVCSNQVRVGSEVREVYRTDREITGIEVQDSGGMSLVRGSNYLSSIPLTVLVRKMRPKPPPEVLAAVDRISFRSLVVVAVMLRRKRVTDLTWLYFPGKEIPFGRIHEPTNWSAAMAPAGQTHLVIEYFCDQGDHVWNASDEKLVTETSEQLQRLGFINSREVIDSRVLKVPHAYPVFSVDYQKHLRVVTDWLERFENLHLIGRSGRYSYLNMDHAMESGIKAAGKVLQRSGAHLSMPERIAACPCRV